MRVFFLHLTKSDFTIVSDTQWTTTSVIDLYRNSSYNNYSTVKSKYGLDAVESVFGEPSPAGVWVGSKWLTDGSITDTGLIYNGRYVDTSGTINLVSYAINIPNYGNTVNLDLYFSPVSDAIWPQEWSSVLGRYISDGLDDLSTVDRYLQLSLNFNSYGPPGDLDFYLRVEIDTPVITTRYQETRNVLSKLPSWMTMRELSNDNPPVRELAVPISTGGALVNAIAGEWLDDLQSQINYRQMQLFIDSADVNQMAWCWKVAAPVQFPYSLLGDGIELAHCVDINELYQSISVSGYREDNFLWDENNQILYTNQLYDTLLINGVAYEQELHQVWNAFDDIGLLVGLDRLSSEDNTSFQHRIRDVFVNHPGAGIESLKLALRRELNIWQVYGATPSSDYLGATPEILEISDLEKDPIYVGPDGIPTSRFVRLVDFLARQYPSTWGELFWDRARSDLAGPNYEGYTILPLRLDATPLLDTQTQSGVGDKKDLYVDIPSVSKGPRPFLGQLQVKGKVRSNITQYLPVQVNATIQGVANKYIYNNPQISVWLTLEFSIIGFSNVSYYSFLATAISDIDVNQPTSSLASAFVLHVFDSDGATNRNFVLFDKLTGNFVGQRLLSQNINAVTLRVGQWNPATQAYINRPTDVFQAWFSNNSTTKIAYNSDTLMPAIILQVSNDPITPTLLPNISVVLISTKATSVYGQWRSELIPLEILINDTGNSTTQSSVTIPVPEVNWDSFLDVIPQKKYIITFTSASLTLSDGTVSNLSGSYIIVNGLLLYSGSLTLDATSTTHLVFSINPGALYPVVGEQWSLFETNQLLPFQGIVDENGPWINGFAAADSNTNFTLMNVRISRSDFGIPNNSSYVLTWIGVDLFKGDPSVLLWINNNNLVENSDYTFPEISIFARVNPNASPQWNPQVHSGTFYEHQQEYYLFSQPQQYWFQGPETSLPSLARQGAPILVSTADATPLRQVCFFDIDSTPTTLDIVNTEIVSGTGLSILNAAYSDIYNISVLNITNPNNPIVVSCIPSTSTNIISTTISTNIASTYQISYRVNHSFYADNEFISATPATPCTYIVCDQHSTPGFYATYESSIYTASTPADLSLNSFYTTQKEGFIYVSHEEADVASLSLYISPSKIIADGQDYILLSIRSIDINGNLKPNQTFSISTSFGTLNMSTITTDNDGFAVVTLISSLASATPASLGTITVNGINNLLAGSIDFSIENPSVSTNRLLAVPTQDEIRANLQDLQIVYGQVQDTSFNPIPYAIVNWRKARSNYDLFALGGNIAQFGQVTANAQGEFQIGPLTSDSTPGFWFMSLESESASPSLSWNPVGDVVFWSEYVDIAFGQENLNGVPVPPVQSTIPINMIPPYAATPTYPVYYYRNEPAGTSVANLNWLPPTWYALPLYSQYQLGLFAIAIQSGHYIRILPTNSIHPYRGELA